MPPRAILLDALGTLVALEPPAAPLARLVGERHGVEVTPADAARALRAEMAHYRAQLHPRRGRRASLAALRLECAALVGRELGGRSQHSTPPELVPTLLESIRFSAYPEVPGALARLRAAGFALVVASNWDVSLHDVLERTGLGVLLDGVVTSAEVGAAKPDPRPVRGGVARRGCRRGRGAPRRRQPRRGRRGRARAGIDAVWLRRGTAARRRGRASR